MDCYSNQLCFEEAGQLCFKDLKSERNSGEFLGVSTLTCRYYFEAAKALSKVWRLVGGSRKALD